MEKIIVAVGSTRRPKLNAVWEALSVFGPSLDDNAQFDIAAVEVPSGVRHTPLSREEMMSGARRRAEALVRIAREKSEPWRYFVGLEGGFDVVHADGRRWVFLENWAYVVDATDCGAFGQSGAVLVPEPLAKRVVDDGIELSEAVDDLRAAAGFATPRAPGAS